MLRFKIGFRKYIVIPSSWEDLTYSQVLAISKCEDDKKAIEIATGLNEINSIQVLPYLQFLLEPISIDDEQPATMFNGVEICDIRSKSFGQKLMIQNEVKKCTMKESICKIIAIYLMDGKFHPERIDEEATKLYQKSFLELHRVALNLINQLKSIIETENRMLKFSPTPEQQRAGIKEFEILGDFNVVDELSQAMRLTYQEVEDTNYNTIFAKLLKMNISAKFDKKYREIMTASQK